MSMPNEVVQFAQTNGGNTDFYVAFQDYYFNRDKMDSEKHDKLQNAFFAEIVAKSGVSRDGLTTEAWVSHPSVQWAAFAVVDATVNAILPQVLTPAFGLFTDFRFVSLGDVVKFKIKPNQFFTVSKGGTGERTIHRQKDFAQDIIVAPVEHIVTVYTDMYRVLAGKEDIADFVARVVLAIEQAMYGDAMIALITGLNNLPVGSYKYSGAFDMKTLVKMAETVQVYNAGVRPVIAGSATALMNVLPDSTLGYRGNYDANGGSIELIKNVYGYDVIKMNNAAAPGGGLVLPDNKIFVVSPAQDKLVKGVVSNALTNSNQFYDNADLTSDYTTRKMWEFVYASAAKAGVYTVTD